MWALLAIAFATDPAIVQGMTLSTPTYGPEWGSPAMEATLDQLAADGVNWIAYHPYAAIDRSGRVRGQVDPLPDWAVSPIREAHARGLKVMVKPHLAHWGSGFSWRGDIVFEDAASQERFFREYTAWITALAVATREADAFVVGTELDRTVAHEAEWRAVIRSVRAVFPGHLTYAANWDTYPEVPFWDALDAIGVQAYFPLVDHGREPTDAELQAGWDAVLEPLHKLSEATGKPVVFTELGYDTSALAAKEPWASGRGHPALQARLLDVALERVAADPMVRGCFLWKWFPGELARGDFRMSAPRLRAVIRENWDDGPTP